MHGVPDDIDKLVPLGHAHCEHVLRHCDLLDRSEHERFCFCWDCKVWFNGDLPLCTRFLSWVGGVLLWNSGAYQGATLRRWLYPKRLLSLKLVNWNSFNGVAIRVDKVAVNAHFNAYVFQRYGGEEGMRRPIYVFCHGGGFTFGSPEEKMFYDYCKYFAWRGFVVVAPDDRLAPEFPFPTPLEDCFETLRFVSLDQSVLAHGDKRRVILGGDSAGGNLALVLATLLRDNLNVSLESEDLSQRLTVLHLVLLYPTLLLPYPTKSMANCDRIMLPYWLSRWMTESYLPDADRRQSMLETDRRLCPLHGSLAGLQPNITLCTGELDPFRDECLILSKELQRQGCSFIHHDFPKVPHGFGTIFCPARTVCQEQTFSDISATLDGCFSFPSHHNYVSSMKKND